jgi:type II secretory pathway component GspD/PulD (secretin)
MRSTIRSAVAQPARLAIAGTALIAIGCVTEHSDPRSPSAPREVKVFTEDELPIQRVSPPWHSPEADEERDTRPFPPGLIAPSAPAPRAEGTRVGAPYHPFTHQTLRSPDGRLTRLYWVRAGSGPIVEPLLRAHTRAGDAALAIITVTQGVQVDPRPVKTYQAGPLADLLPGMEKVSDLVTVTSSDDVLLEVDTFLSALLTETPQVEIEATVVEITFDDDVEIGTNLFIDERAPHYKQNPDGTETFTGAGNDKSTLFGQLLSPLDPDAFLAGNRVGSLSLAFFENDIRYRAVIRAIQTSSNAEVLSSPKMAVLNGHRAVIDTGTRQPVLQPVLGNNGNLTQVQIRFEDTGIKLIVTPYVLMDDIIQIDLTAEVSFVSGFIETGQTGILNPIISERTASTVINVRDGQPFAIGGLKLTNKVSRASRIPILGDIPILGYLFKTESLVDRQSKVVFLIKPTLFRQPPPLFDPSR